MDQGLKRDQVADGDADLDRLARKSDQLCATGPNGLRAARTIALAIWTFADLLQSGQIFIDIPSQPLRKILPGRAFRRLERRLDKFSPWPVGVVFGTGVPGTGHRPTGRAVGVQRGRLLAVG